MLDFNPRPPRGGRRPPPRTASKRRVISIHALREEGDRCLRSQSRPPHYFNPRPPRGGRRAIVRDHECRGKFQSTPSARRATDVLRFAVGPCNISIHALREEGDPSTTHPASAQMYFNPRPPRGERPDETGRYRRAYRFQSTPSERRATPGLSGSSSVSKYFNPRPPRGERRRQTRPKHRNVKFQSTPSARRATSCACAHVRTCVFQSTPSARRATCRAGFHRCKRPYFNPRPPRGERLALIHGESFGF